jgi:hypothetical protein
MDKITTDRDRDRNERGQKERKTEMVKTEISWQSWNDASHQGESISQGIFPR